MDQNSRIQMHSRDVSNNIDLSVEGECTDEEPLIKEQPINRRGLNADRKFPYNKKNQKCRQWLRILQIRISKKVFFLLGFAITVVILSEIHLLSSSHGSKRLASLPGWDQNKSRSVPFYILPDVHTTIIEPSSLCKTSDPILILIIVCSAVDNFDTRQALRETWANTTEFNYSKFSTIHANFYGKYLSFNYPNWRNYTVKNQNTNSFADVTVDEYGREIEDSNAFWDSSQADFQIKVVFLVGQTENNETQAKIVEESQLFNDMIQESFLDTYNNLTLKTIMMLKWVNSNCMDKVKFLMKTDDDTFVNVPNLIHVLLGGTVPVYDATEKGRNWLGWAQKNRLSDYNDLLIGYLFRNEKPHQDVRSKWYVPHYMYDKDKYPNYLSGTGYVMSIDTVAKLYNASLETPVFHLEDVFLTGICAEKAQVYPKNHYLFNCYVYTDLCEIRAMITKHRINPHDTRKAYDFLLNSRHVCAT